MAVLHNDIVLYIYHPPEADCSFLMQRMRFPSLFSFFYYFYYDSFYFYYRTMAIQNDCNTGGATKKKMTMTTQASRYVNRLNRLHLL